ncbi:hypothetical protein QFC21_002461 [Naganishia friedmannii]|uniref:Uncharacterized protein n=1 Tax=Naganishia friedmannii TaxID=89922 RepID=A0ACC2VY47_9TREE|nr:hypothetical protein QFC21_002461 [Naganishia friedmannii]
MPHSRQPTIAPFGTWKSPLDSEAVYRKRSSVTELLVDKITGDVFHIEVSGFNCARKAVVLLIPDFLHSTYFSLDPTRQDDASNVRTKVHEYGGGAARVHGGVAYWSEAKDGRIYRRKVGTGADLRPIEAVTPDCHKHRFADFDIHPFDNNLLICIKEDHTDETQVTNGLILINLKYATMQEIRSARIDGFYAFPRFGGIHGDKIAWIEWKHPDMPWNGTELYYSAFSIPTSKQPIQLCPIKIAGKRS